MHNRKLDCQVRRIGLRTSWRSRFVFYCRARNFCYWLIVIKLWTDYSKAADSSKKTKHCHKFKVRKSSKVYHKIGSFVGNIFLYWNEKVKNVFFFFCRLISVTNVQADMEGPWSRSKTTERSSENYKNLERRGSRNGSQTRQ